MQKIEMNGRGNGTLINFCQVRPFVWIDLLKGEGIDKAGTENEEIE